MEERRDLTGVLIMGKRKDERDHTPARFGAEIEGTRLGVWGGPVIGPLTGGGREACVTGCKGLQIQAIGAGSRGRGTVKHGKEGTKYG